MRFEQLSGVPVDDAGMLHNALLAEFDRLRSLDDPSVLPREDLARIYVDAANSVLAANNGSFNFTETDVNVFLWYLDQFADVFDFYGNEISNPWALIARLHGRGLLDDGERNDLSSMIASLHRSLASMISKIAQRPLYPVPLQLLHPSP